MKSFASPKLRASGFTLLEVLISIVLLSFGVLGLLGLQMSALQAQREARWHHQALSMARELSEMMRSNRQIATQTDASLNPYLGSYDAGALEPTAPNYCLSEASSDTSAGCATPHAVAQAQMTDWLGRLDLALPEARVTICMDAQPYDNHGQPQWACTDAATSMPFIKLGWTLSSTNSTRTDAQRLVRSNVSAPTLIIPVNLGKESAP